MNEPRIKFLDTHMGKWSLYSEDYLEDQLTRLIRIRDAGSFLDTGGGHLLDCIERFSTELMDIDLIQSGPSDCKCKECEAIRNRINMVGFMDSTTAPYRQDFASFFEGLELSCNENEEDGRIPAPELCSIKVFPDGFWGEEIEEDDEEDDELNFWRGLHHHDKEIRQKFHAALDEIEESGWLDHEDNQETNNRAEGVEEEDGYIDLCGEPRSIEDFPAILAMMPRVSHKASRPIGSGRQELEELCMIKCRLITRQSKTIGSAINFVIEEKSIQDHQVESTKKRLRRKVKRKLSLRKGVYETGTLTKH